MFNISVKGFLKPKTVFNTWSISHLTGIIDIFSSDIYLPFQAKSFFKGHIQQWFA